MHSIKRAAHRSAWYENKTPENRTYNLWGRADTRQRKLSDEENTPIHHVSTENDATSPAEASRRNNFQSENEYGGVHKHGTFPQGPTGHLPRPSQERGIDDGITSSENSKESAELTNVNSTKEQRGDTDLSAGQPRKRKMRKFMPWKKDEQQDQGDIPEDEMTDQQKKRKNWPKPTFMGQLKAVFGSWINILLIMVPVGIALEYAGVNKVAVFVVNFIAIIPLAAVLAYATEELALYIGEVLGGLLNATFGNAVELIVGVIALTQDKVLIVQTSLIGSMLSNLLLVLGMCFFFGGLRRTEQFFNVTVAQTAASLLALAIGSLIIPTAFKIFAQNDSGVAPTSRGTAVLLLVTYACYLFFQLRTHTDMYNEPSQKAPKKKSGKKDKGEVSKGLATMGAGTGAAAAGGQINNENMVHEEEEEGEVPQLSVIGALVTLGGSTVLVALCAEYMVSAINVIATKGVSEEFIGLILLPIVGNAAEHATAVTVAIKDKMDLAIGVAVGSSLQIALLVLPLMVMFSWWGVGSGDPALTLSFDGFQVAVIFIAIIVVNYLIQDGKSHWLEGVLLQITYLIIALSAWFYPTSKDIAG